MTRENQLLHHELRLAQQRHQVLEDATQAQVSGWIGWMEVGVRDQVVTKDRAVGRKWVHKMEPWQMEPRSKTCAPWWFGSGPYQYVFSLLEFLDFIYLSGKHFGGNRKAWTVFWPIHSESEMIAFS